MDYNIRNTIRSIKNESPMDVSTSVAAALSAKVGAALDIRKVEVASDMFDASTGSTGKEE
jgi:hypothetical protein